MNIYDLTDSIAIVFGPSKGTNFSYPHLCVGMIGAIPNARHPERPQGVVPFAWHKDLVAKRRDQNPEGYCLASIAQALFYLG